MFIGQDYLLVEPRATVELRSILFKDILCIIPMKDVQEAKKRLRRAFSDDKQAIVSSLVSQLFVSTITNVRELFDFAVVSPSDDILDIALDSGASFVYQDLGIDLNDALRTCINYFIHLNKYKAVFILTADLPFLTTQSLKLLISNTNPSTFFILSAPKKGSELQGTSGLLIPIHRWPSIELEFGTNSFNKFIQQFIRLEVEFKSSNDIMGFDLDEVSDLQVMRNLIFDKMGSVAPYLHEQILLLQ